jgi:hypothetical protein
MSTGGDMAWMDCPRLINVFKNINERLRGGGLGV